MFLFIYYLFGNTEGKLILFFVYFFVGQKFALLEEKAVISSLLRDYKIKSVDSRDKLIMNELILRPHNGVNLILESRK